MCIFLTVGDLKKVGSSGEKGGKMCGCLREKDYKHSPLARKIKLSISYLSCWVQLLMKPDLLSGMVSRNKSYL
jgi:hypothetical protein